MICSRFNSKTLLPSQWTIKTQTRQCNYTETFGTSETTKASSCNKVYFLCFCCHFIMNWRYVLFLTVSNVTFNFHFLYRRAHMQISRRCFLIILHHHLTNSMQTHKENAHYLATIREGMWGIGGLSENDAINIPWHD